MGYLGSVAGLAQGVPKAVVASRPWSPPQMEPGTAPGSTEMLGDTAADPSRVAGSAYVLPDDAVQSHPGESVATGSIAEPGTPRSVGDQPAVVARSTRNAQLVPGGELAQAVEQHPTADLSATPQRRVLLSRDGPQALSASSPRASVVRRHGDVRLPAASYPASLADGAPEGVRRWLASNPDRLPPDVAEPDVTVMIDRVVFERPPRPAPEPVAYERPTPIGFTDYEALRKR